MDASPGFPTALTPLPRLERAVGKVGLAVFRRDGIDAIHDLRQQGCGRLLFPHRDPRGPLEAVVVNTSGGLTGGDRFDVSVSVRAGASAIVTTQACEKIYRSGEGPGRITAKLTVGSGASLLWMPQETILFEDSALKRKLEADIAPDGILLIGEAVMLGRAAMGEQLQRAAFRDSWRIRRDGKLVFAEEMAAGPRSWPLARGARAGIGADTAAFATLLLAGPQAAGKLEPARAFLQLHGIDGGVSLVDGLLIARLVAGPGLALRRAMIPLLELFSGARLPRVWTT